MAELLDVLNAFTTPLKVAWVVWFAWGVGQVFWYRHERKPQTASKRPSAPPVRKPFVSKPSGSDRVVTRLVTPEQVITHQPEPVAPAPVESAQAADNVAGEVGELDRFVADFEMNTRQRRGQPHNGESYNAHPGA
jgi:hypothetical protein